MENFKNRIIGYDEVDPEQLLANPRNWRIHPQNQQEALEGVLEEVGWIDDIIVNQQTGFVVDGHLRVSLAISKGEAKVPVKYVDLTEEEEMIVLATIDPIAAMAATDRDKLSEVFDSIQSDNEQVQQLLDDIAKKERIDRIVEEDPGAQIDKADELQEKWQVERGQVWQIGSHRLMCGDSTSEEDVGRLMDGEKAGAVVTDPPYGQNQKGITGDDPEELINTVTGAIKALPIENAIIVAFQSPRTFPAWLDAIRDNGHRFERMLWLDKVAQCSFPWRGWILKSESILVSVFGSGQWQDVHPYQHDIYRLPEVSGELSENLGWHGSVKPLSVVLDIIQRVSPSRELIFDGFIGSGTTMVAAQQLNRICYGMEIEPKYCAVTLERMSEMGLEPNLYNVHIDE